MAKIKKHINDKFYTKEEVVKKLLTLIDLNKYDRVIEPSAGNGSFSKNISHQNILSMDIEPESDFIIKQDWFTFVDIDESQKTLVIGNPPFGNQGKLALNFIKKCDELNIDMVAFILPKSFRKKSTINKIPLKYHLIEEVDLDDNSFLLLGEDYSVPCIFQIWERKSQDREKYLLKTTSEYIDFVKKTDSPDYSLRRVGYYAGEVYDDTDKSEQSHYFIKSNKEVKNFLTEYIWEHNNTVGPRSIGKYEIIQAIEEWIKK